MSEIRITRISSRYFGRRSFYSKPPSSLVDGDVYGKSGADVDKKAVTFGNGDFAIIKVITEGGCEYTFDDGTHFFAKPGDILYLAKGSSYKMVLNAQSYSVIYFNVSFDSAEERKSAVYSPDAALGAQILFRRILSAYHRKDGGYLCECMALAYRIYGIIVSVGNTSYLERSAKEKMLDAKNYIDRNYSDPALSVKNLAQNMGVSDVYFRRLFKSATGISPAKYISSVRLAKARGAYDG